MTNDTPPKKVTTPSVGKYYLVSMLALVLAIIAITFVTIMWQQQNTVRSSSESQSLQLQQSITQLKITIGQYQQQTQEALTANQKDIDQLMRQTYQTSQQQSLAEAGYLIRLSNLNLIIENNLLTGIQLLKMAQQLLQPIAASPVTALKQAINNDIKALSVVPEVDTPDLINQIDLLSNQISDLPMEPQLTPPPLETAIGPNPGENWWDKVKRNLSGLQNLFVVHRIDMPVAPVLHPQQMLLLKESVRFKLLQAQWALLHQQPSLYAQSLNTAAELLEAYDQNHPATSQIIKKLHRLAIINIKPQIPSLQSLRILESLSIVVPLPQKEKEETENTIS